MSIYEIVVYEHILIVHVFFAKYCHAVNFELDAQKFVASVQLKREKCKITFGICLELLKYRAIHRLGIDRLHGLDFLIKIRLNSKVSVGKDWWCFDSVPSDTNVNGNRWQ